jgi:hypothetical protein
MGLGQVKDIMSTGSIRVNKHSQRIMAPVFKLFVLVNWGYQEFFVVFVYSDGLKLGPHGYMRKGVTAGTSELLYPNCVGEP